MKVRPFIPADAPAWVALGHTLTDRQTTDEFVRAENERRAAAGQIDCR